MVPPRNPKTKLIGGEAIVALPLSPREEELAFAPEDIVLDIVFEDDTVMVINKPPGW